MSSDKNITEHCHDPLEEYLRNMTRRRFFGAMANTTTQNTNGKVK